MADNKDQLLEKEEILRLEILPEFSEIATSTHLLRDFFCKNNFSIDRANEICLVIEELTANTIMHGYKNAAAQDREKIIVEVKCNSGKRISILFRDAGIPFDPTLPRPSREEGTVGGWGLTLVKKIMNSFEYERNGKYNVLRLLKNYG